MSISSFTPARAMALAGLFFCPLQGCGDRSAALSTQGRAGTIASAGQTQWVQAGRFTVEAEAVLRAMTEARTDGLDPARYAVASIRSARPEAAATMLGEAFARYANDLGSPPDRIFHVDAELAPRSLPARERLAEAAGAPSINVYLERLRAPNPIAAMVRTDLAKSPSQGRAGLAADLARLRLIRADRFVLVDTASQRLWMVENGRAAGSMKLVVGKAGMETPMMTGLIRYASLNPYWHVPIDLVRNRVRENVLTKGTGYFRQARLEPVTAYGPEARVVDAAKVDWRAVASGRRDIGLRQLPGPQNMMGAVKFMFPNPLGIYLHDTPNRGLFARAERRFSSGCVRLERAGELYRWLFGADLPLPDARRPERRMDLPQPVPVYILDLPSLRNRDIARDLSARQIAAPDTGRPAARFHQPRKSTT